MESYLVIKPDNSSGNKSYRLTTNANKPRLNVSNSYIPLTTQGKEGTNVKIKDGNTAYRLMEYSTVSSSSSMQTTETTGYSGVLSRQSNYNTTSNAPGAMSNVTNLTRQSVSGYSGISSRASTYGYSGYNRVAVATETIYAGYYAAGYTGGVTGYYAVSADTNYAKVNGVAYSTSPSGVYDSGYGNGAARTASIYALYKFTIQGNNGGVLGYGGAATGITLSSPIYHYFYSDVYTTSPSYFNGAGAMTQQSNYYTSSNAVAGMWNVTNLTRQSVSGYSGVLSRQSNYNYTSAVPGSMSSVTALTASSSSSTSASTTSYV